MPIKSSRFILTVFFVVHVLLVNAKFNEYSPASVNYITVANGLPQNTVQCIEKDHFGFMWFGTDNGLCRYDGYDFDYYETSREENALWDNRIIDVVSDNNHLLWITSSKGLQVFNTLTNKFEVIEENVLNELFREKILHVQVDGNTVWVVTQNQGVYELNVGDHISDTEIKNHYFEGDNLPNASFIEICEEGSVFLGTSNGLYLLDTGNNRFEKTETAEGILDNLNIQTLYDTETEMWIGSPNGLYRFNKTTKETTIYAHDPSDNTTIPHWNITCNRGEFVRRNPGRNLRRTLRFQQGEKYFS